MKKTALFLLICLMLGVGTEVQSQRQGSNPTGGSALPSGCANGEIAVFNSTSRRWDCGSGGGGGGAPTSSKYIVQTADAGLSAEQSLGLLTTALLLNTVSAATGVLSAYAGIDCTNQFVRDVSAAGAGTCASVANADLAGSIAASKLVATDITVVGTLATWAIGAAPTITDGVKITFNPDATNAGLNIGAGTTDPSSPANGDLFYDSDDNLLRARIGGAWVSLGAAGGSGDIDAVVAGAGLTGGATSGSATVDVGEGLAIDAAADAVAFDPTELTGSRTWGDASTDTIVWTINRATGTDPTLTFGSASLTINGDIFVADEAYVAANWDADLSVPTKNSIRDILETYVTITDANDGDHILFLDDSAGTVTKLDATMAGLTISGTALSVDWTATKTLTNTTYDVEGTGNVFTFAGVWHFIPAVCNNTTPALAMSTFTAAQPTAICITGSNVTRGAAQLPDTDGEYALVGELQLPHDFTGTLDVRGKWRAGATSGDIVMQFQWACTADAEVANDTWSTASTVTDTAKGTTLQFNDYAITGITVTGCAATENVAFRLFRQRTNASDTLTGTLDLLPFNITARRGI